MYPKLSLLNASSFNKIYHPTLSVAYAWYSLNYLWAPKLHLHIQWDFDQLTVALEFKNDYIIYYDMDALWSVGLVQTNFAHPDYLVVQCLVSHYLLSPDTINQTGPHYLLVCEVICRKGGLHTFWHPV